MPNLKGTGACWPLSPTIRLILFGRYRTRAVAAGARRGDFHCSLRGFGDAAVLAAGNWVWSGSLALTAVGVLMWGGVFGLAVTDDYWGGLPIT